VPVPVVVVVFEVIDDDPCFEQAGLVVAVEALLA
jgi:hypothetical protein